MGGDDGTAIDGLPGCAAAPGRGAGGGQGAVGPARAIDDVIAVGQRRHANHVEYAAIAHVVIGRGTDQTIGRRYQLDCSGLATT